MSSINLHCISQNLHIVTCQSYLQSFLPNVVRVIKVPPMTITLCLFQRFQFCFGEHYSCIFFAWMNKNRNQHWYWRYNSFSYVKRLSSLLPCPVHWLGFLNRTGYFEHTSSSLLHLLNHICFLVLNIQDNFLYSEHWSH